MPNATGTYPGSKMIQKEVNDIKYCAMWYEGEQEWIDDFSW